VLGRDHCGGLPNGGATSRQPTVNHISSCPVCPSICASLLRSSLYPSVRLLVYTECPNSFLTTSHYLHGTRYKQCLRRIVCFLKDLSMALQPLWTSSAPWAGNQLVARPLPTHRTTQTQNKRTRTSMPRVGSEPTIPVFERAKTALDRAATVIG
jgi:hypothetical protein